MSKRSLFDAEPAATNPERPPPGTGVAGSWNNPMYRKRDKTHVCSTTVLIPVDMLKQLDHIRLTTRRRLSDIIEEATREWLKQHEVEP